MNNYYEYEDIVYKVIGAAMNVHSELKWGLMEQIYQEALHIELKSQGIPNDREKEILCFYKQYVDCNLKVYQP